MNEKNKSEENLPVIVVPVEAVQLCIANSKRLLIDSDSVSEPTEAALVEIALEEVLKAWVLFFNLNDSARWSKTDRNAREKMSMRLDPRISKEIMAETEKLKEEYAKIIPSNQFLSAIFKGPQAHSKKLQTFEYVKRHCELLSKIVPDGLDLNDVLQWMGHGFVKLSEAENEVVISALKELVEQFSRIDEKKIRSVVYFKESGLYVNLEGSVFISPDFYPFLFLDEIKDIVYSLIHFLSGMFMSVVKGSNTISNGA